MNFGPDMKSWFRLNPRRRRWLVIVGVIGLSGYGAYKVYNLPAVARRRRRLVKLVDSIMFVSEMVSNSVEATNVIFKDLKEFLKSDSDEVPRSIRQICKLAKSPEFSESLTVLSQALISGMLRGYNSNIKADDRLRTESDSDFVDKVLEKMTSDSGTGFVSVVVGSFAKNMVIGYFESGRGSSSDTGSSGLSVLVNFVCDDKFKALALSCVEKFVSTAVTVFLDKTIHINTYDDFFAGLTNPNHQDNVRDVLVSVCNNAVETLVRTSHQIMSKPQPSSSSTSKCAVFEQEKQYSDNGSWVNQVSSTLSVPSNRKFVLDVTGRVTFETVRSVVEYVLFKMSDGVKNNFEEIAERGKKVVRYVGAKSYLILTICLALYLHIFGETRIRLAA